MRTILRAPTGASLLTELPPMMDIVRDVARGYDREPRRIKLIDSFMAFLVVLGVLQFVFCILVGNFPFNAFLGGFASTVGQFVLLASLRIQINPANKGDFKEVSSNRAFIDFVLGSLILHFLVYHFIN